MKKRILSLITITVLCMSLFVPGAWADTFFSDVPYGNWAYNSIKEAYENGWVRGYDDGTYKPNGQVTNAEFITMITNAFYDESVQEISEALEGMDMSWYEVYLVAADGNGLLEGVSFEDDTFNAWYYTANLPMSRYDMSQVMSNVMGENGFTVTSSERQAAQYAIGDWSSVPYAFQDAVSSSYALGLLMGMDDGTFSGASNMTRAQAAVVLCRLENSVGRRIPEIELPVQPEIPTVPAVTEEIGAEPSDLQSKQSEMLEIINMERANAGLDYLSLDDELCEVAQIRAEELTELYSHTRPDGRRWSTALQEFGITCRSGGENITDSTDSSSYTMNVWMNSEGHRENILTPEFTEVGIGCVYSGNDYFPYYWVQIFTEDKESAGQDTGYPDYSDKDYPGYTDTADPDNTDTDYPTDPDTDSTDVPDNEDTAVTEPEDETLDLESVQQEMLEIINAERAAEGRGPLTLDAELCEAAQIRAEELTVRYSHVRPDESMFQTVLEELGIRDYSVAGENIAGVYSTVNSVMNGWMNSPGHKANIIASDFTKIGIGYIDDGYGGPYWVQLFTNGKVNSKPDTGHDNSTNTDTTVTEPEVTPLDLETLQMEMLEMINAERSRAGEETILLDDELCEAAQIRAEEIAEYYSEYRSDGSLYSTVLDELLIDYKLAAENRSSGETTVEEVMDKWMSSYSDSSMILYSGFTAVGVGYTVDADGTPYWVQLFTRYGNADDPVDNGGADNSADTDTGNTDTDNTDSSDNASGGYTLANGKPINDANVQEILYGLKSSYPEGMSWTNANSHYSPALYTTGFGCAGFGLICSDAVFGNMPETGTHSDFNKIRVGDMVRMNYDTHTVVVLEKLSDSIIVTEGNYNNSIHWGREISRQELVNTDFYVTTRYPY